MSEIGADYLGGDPALLTSYEDGTLTARAGSLVFRGPFLTSAMTTEVVELTIPKEEIVAISVGDPNRMRMLTAAFIGDAVFGAAGALVGAANARRDHMLVVAVRRGGLDLRVSFRVRGDEGNHLITAMQSGRHSRGEPPLPSVEQLAQAGAVAVEDRQLLLLEELRALMVEQNRLLTRLVDRTG